MTTKKQVILVNGPCLRLAIVLCCYLVFTPCPAHSSPIKAPAPIDQSCAEKPPQTQAEYVAQISKLLYANKEADATLLLNQFLKKFPPSAVKKHNVSRLADIYGKTGNLLHSYELYIKAFGFIVFLLSGIVVFLFAAGLYMGVFSIIKYFFRRNIPDSSPKVFRPKHIFYFVFWMLLIPFIFNICFAWYCLSTSYTANSLDFSQFSILFFDLVLVMISLIYLRKKYHLDNQAIGFVSRGFTINVLLPLGIVAVETVVILIIACIFHHFKIKTHPTPIHHIVTTTLQSHASSSVLIMFLTMVVIGPMAEEIVFRGYFYNAFKKHLNVPWAVFLSAVMFASGHDPQPLVFVILLITGTILAVVYEKTKSLVPCMVCHGLHNLIAFCAILSTTPRA